jgi:hypothetical protein
LAEHSRRPHSVQCQPSAPGGRLRRALAQQALSPHFKGMDKPHTQFEPIQLEADSAWRVRVTLPHGVQHYVSSFKTEDEARTWIDENSAVWLMRYAGGIFV